MGGDFDHMRMCVGRNRMLRGPFPRATAEARFLMIEITKNCDGGHRNARATGLD